MLFNSLDYLIFFPIVLMVLFIVPRKLRRAWLLICSYYFYMCWNPRYVILILISTVVTYLTGISLEKFRNEGKKQGFLKLILVISLIVNLGILFIFKYADFVIENINRILGLAGYGGTVSKLDLLLPVGISFYTFQALSYALDVYYDRIKAEKNFFRYALFVSFFPQLVAGPIERTRNLLPQINNLDKVDLWDKDNIKEGFLYILWGLFQKLVIADRLSLLVNEVYGNYEQYGLLEILTATVFFGIQIYCDFGGYSNIAIGSARIMGVRLMQNFRQPYFAVSIKDFWRRWHISLTSWFTDYIYIPLGGSRKGLIRKYVNIAIVFLISGLWHGASWNFVFWGGLHALYQILEDVLSGRKNRKRVKNKSRLKTVLSALGVFLLADFAWLFFASDSLSDAFKMIQCAASRVYVTNIFNIGMEKFNYGLLFIAVIVLLIVDLYHEKDQKIYQVLSGKKWVFQSCFYVFFVWAIIMTGIYGVDYDASQFIYFQF